MGLNYSKADADQVLRKPISFITVVGAIEQACLERACDLSQKIYKKWLDRYLSGMALEQ